MTRDLTLGYIAAYIILHVSGAIDSMTRRSPKAERLKALQLLNRHPERVRAAGLLYEGIGRR